MYIYVYVCMYSFLDGYCSTVQGLLHWFEVDLGFTEFLFIQIDLCVLCVVVRHSPVSLSYCPLFGHPAFDKWYDKYFNLYHVILYCYVTSYYMCVMSVCYVYSICVTSKSIRYVWHQIWHLPKGWLFRNFVLDARFVFEILNCQLYRWYGPQKLK